MAAKKFTRITGTMQASALRHAEPDRLFGGSRQGMRFVEPRIDDIDLNPHQPRRHFNPDALQALADSIEQHGQKQPIGVQQQDNGRWLLVFGERRLRACRQIGLSTIQAVVTDGDPLEIALIENLQREDLSVFETADAYTSLMAQRGYNRSTLARVVGSTPTAITRLMALRNMPPAIRRDVESQYGDVAKSLLLEVAEITDPADQAQAWRAVKDGATVRELRALKAGFKAPPPALDAVEGDVTAGDFAPAVIAPADEPTRPRGGRDILEKSVIRLEKLVRPYRDGAVPLQNLHRTRLAALRDMIDELLRR